MRSTFYMIAGVLLAASSDAHADWQYTRWTMTIDEVAKSSNGQLKPCDPQSCSGQAIKDQRYEIALVGNYLSGAYKFKAFLYFDKSTKRLSLVSLKLDDPTGGFRLGADLKAKYGEPTKMSNTAISKDMEWRTKTDEISFSALFHPTTMVVSYATVRYTPRQTANNKGL